MAKPLGLASVLLISSALVAPSVAQAQAAPGTTGEDSAQTQGPAAIGDPQAETQAAGATPAPQDQAQPEVSVPGGSDIVVTGRRGANQVRASSGVTSVLSTADIARTGEGDIAGALGRVTGLSVVGNGFVYVRGLGDRYSLALLNGSPLPSPEPLRRVVPLDLFPTEVIASSLVQKSYSVNFPGEFGGGVINLTTKAIPKESFLSVSGGIGGDSETTGQLGYTYFGSSSDWTGFDNGTRDLAPALDAYFKSGERISSGNVDTQAIASQLVTGRNGVIQRNRHLPPNWKASLTAGSTFELGSELSLGVIATAGYSNKWRTRDTIQQSASSQDLSQKELDFERVITDDHVVVNGLLGFGLEFGKNKIRWTNLYIRDTLKQARLGVGTRATSGLATLQQQDTAWYERQLIDTQLVGEFKLGEFDIGVRGGYANSQREAPAELSLEYYRSNDANDPYGKLFINRLNNGQQGSASIAYSNLNEDLWSGGVDLSYKITPGISATVGYAYSNTKRRTERRDFQFVAPSTFPRGVDLLRPDYLLGRAVIKAFGVGLIDTNEANPVFDATLLNHAGYAQLKAEIVPGLTIDTGVRYETAKQTVSPVQVFAVPTASLASTKLDRSYWLPAATLTWEFAPDMQLRISGSKTIARPQFRELIFQSYFDPDTNRQYRGNPLLQDSQLYNAEARYEWYFAREQRLSIAGFYKKIDHPIEAFTSFNDNTTVTSYANAPKATLYGVETEAQKYFDLSGISKGSFFASRRAVIVANYTYSKSKLQVGANDPVAVFAASSTKATDFFKDGAPLTGQSEHLANLEFGLEDKDRLSQQTILLTYASRRVTSRGAAGLPDIYEKPGIHLDFVARQGVKIHGISTELKLEVRNITGTRYEELQENGAKKIYVNRYDVGTTGMFGISFNF